MGPVRVGHIINYGKIVWNNDLVLEAAKFSKKSSIAKEGSYYYLDWEL